MLVYQRVYDQQGEFCKKIFVRSVDSTSGLPQLDITYIAKSVIYLIRWLVEASDDVVSPSHEITLKIGGGTNNPNMFLSEILNDLPLKKSDRFACPWHLVSKKIIGPVIQSLLSSYGRSFDLRIFQHTPGTYPQKHPPTSSFFVLIWNSFQTLGGFQDAFVCSTKVCKKDSYLQDVVISSLLI